MIRSAKRNFAATASAAVCALLMVGCAATASVPATGPQTGGSYSAEDTVAVFRGLSYDYDPARSPDELAKLSKIVVSGTVAKVQAGRTEKFPGNDEAKGATSIVLVLADAKATAGELDAGGDGTVYIELPDPGHPDSDYYSKAFPAGAFVVAYLLPAPGELPLEGSDVAIEDPDAGRPQGQPLYLPANPQGLAIQFGAEDIVWPLIGAQEPGRISETLPGGDLIAE